MKTISKGATTANTVIERSNRLFHTAPAKAYTLIDEYLRTATGISSSGKADLYLQRAIANRMLGNYQDAIVDLERALPIYLRHNSTTQLASVYFNLGTCCIYTLEYKKAHTNLHQALRLHEQAQNKEGVIKGCIALGALLLNIDDYINALVYLFKAKEEGEAAGIGRYNASIFNNISEIYFKTRQFSLAFDYGQRSLRARAKEDAIGYAYSLNNLGNILVELKEFDKGLRYLQRAYHLRKKIGNSITIANSLVNIGIGYQRQGDTRRALYYLKKSIAAAYAAKNNYSISAGHHFLAVALFEKGLIDEAVVHMHKALEYGQPLGVDSNELDIRTQLAEYYRLMNDHEQHARELRTCAALKERILSEARERSIIAIELSYELRQAVTERDQYRAHAERYAKAFASSQQELLAATLDLTRKQGAIRSLEAILKRNNKQQTDEVVAEDIHMTIRKSEHSASVDHYEALYSAFIARLRSINASLTPTEIRICILIRLNLSIKKIADTLFIAEGTVKQHRNHIRKKLHLADKENLASYLLSL